MEQYDPAMILTQRIESEQDGLLNDIALWKAALPEGTTIYHHVVQFEKLCTWMIGRLERSFSYRPDRWPNLDPSTFKSLIVSVLGGKWILLRQVVQQRYAGSPYIKAVGTLDEFADHCYQRMRTTLQGDPKVMSLSESSPLVYLGPIARLFLFDEEAPCLISAPFGAANDKDNYGRFLARQTIPHEVGHAIFEQVSGFLDELKFKTNAGLASTTTSKKQGLIRSVILNWLEEIVADMTGTALVGRDFAESASQITLMPERMIGITDGQHPIPLLRVYVHGWVLEQLYPDAAPEFNKALERRTADYFDKPFQSLPAVITVTMQEVKKELLEVVKVMWECKLDTLHGCSLGTVLRSASQTPAPSTEGRVLPTWGDKPGRGEELIFRLIGPGDLTSPLPGLPLYTDLICCPLKLQLCCSQTVA